MVIDTATFDIILAICIAVCATVVFSGACVLYMLKKAKLI